MSQRKGLGRGLGALLGQNEEEYERAMSRGGRGGGADEAVANGTGAEPTELSIAKIDPDADQPRKRFDDAAMGELANSIRKHGVIQPITVVPKNGRYMIVTGERRYRACKKVGLTSIPAIIREYTEQQIREISLIENLQRDDLNPIETANALKQLMSEFGYTQEQVADQVGKSRPYITNTLRLLTLSAPVVDFVAAGRLSAGHARCLVTVENPDDQLALARKALDDKVNVRDFERMVKDFLTPREAKPKPVQSIELKELVSNMQRVFKTKVTAFGSDNKGRIYIDYFTRDDLDRILDIISGADK